MVDRLGGGEETSPAIRASMAGPQSSKQYCAFVGSRSMFEHTVDRAARVASLQQTVVVAARHHRRELSKQLFARPIRKLIHQPISRDTAAGISCRSLYGNHDPRVGRDQQSTTLSIRNGAFWKRCNRAWRRLKRCRIVCCCSASAGSLGNRLWMDSTRRSTQRILHALGPCGLVISRKPGSRRPTRRSVRVVWEHARADGEDGRIVAGGMGLFPT